MSSPLPVFPSPRTRTLCSRQAGASERMIPAHAVPWPQTSPSSSGTIAHFLSVERHRDRALDPADERVVAVDAAVEDADVDALAGRVRRAPTPS